MVEQLPIPQHFQPEKVGEVWKVDYEGMAAAALEWRRRHRLTPAAADERRVCLLAIDVQNTFCIPGYELFVGGRSGTGAVDDNRRLCEFIYRHLHRITRIIPTMDTHQAMQIFHSFFFVDEAGHHPAPMTMITSGDIEAGHWRFNPALSRYLGRDPEQMRKYLLYYTRRLERHSKYTLTVWPYHAMLGGIGHALVPAFEEALFFHSIARESQPNIRIKGRHPLTEHYSALQPEVTHDAEGRLLVGLDRELLEELLSYDAIVVAGQAKSHCVAWTVSDLLENIQKTDPKLAQKVYLLDDCASAVCVPGVVDFTDDAEAAYRRFVEAGMKVVRSTEGIREA